MSDENSSVVVTTPVVNSETPAVETVDLTPKSAVVETVAETPKVEETPKEKIAPKLSKLKEREAKVLERETAAAKRFEEAESESAKAKESAALIESLKTNPSKVLDTLGITFNDLAKALLDEEVKGDATPSELDSVKQSLEEIRKELQDKKDADALAVKEAQDAGLTAAIEGIKVRINEHIDQNADKYDLIKNSNAQELVYEIMRESYEQSEKGEIMQYTDACDLAEEYLTGEVKKLLGSKKIREMVAPSPPPKPQKTSFGKTLSSQATVTAATSNGKPDLSKLNHEERIREILKTHGLRYN